MSKSFQDVHLATDLVRARSGQGGPVGGAEAAIRTSVGRGLLGRISAARRLAAAGTGDRSQLELVIEAPTWRLARPIEPGREQAAARFAAEINSAARRAAVATWWPIAG
jgi:hypothetical protein